MNKQQTAELSEILYGLAGNFGDQIDKPTVKMWIKAFDADGVTLEQIRKAAGQILRTRRISKMPTYAEFIGQIYGDSKDRAQAQADVVLDFLRRNGARTDPEFEDPVTAFLMSARWKYREWAAGLKESEVVWWRKEFIEAYQSYAKKPEMISTARQLGAGEKVKQLAAEIGG